MRMRLSVVPTGRTTATVLMSQEEVDRIRGSAGMARLPVAITYEGGTHRTSVSRYRGEWMLVVNAEMREAGLVPGASYDVDIALDSEPRTVAVPADLQTAIDAAGVVSSWEALSYTRRKEHVRTVEEAKRPDTRTRRIEAVVASLMQ